MNQDVQSIQQDIETSSVMINDRLSWDWRNPLIALPLATIGVLLVSAIVMLVSLVGA
jgi:hypothetical protein